ncbi:MAG: hypothetical protein H7836_01580 [Magnetococcus sp. YQC-3]
MQQEHTQTSSTSSTDAEGSSPASQPLKELAMQQEHDQTSSTSSTDTEGSSPASQPLNGGHMEQEHAQTSNTVESINQPEKAHPPADVGCDESQIATTHGGMMTKAEALAISQELKDFDKRSRSVGEVALDFEQRKGFRLLGYPSLKQWMMVELPFTWQHIYRLLKAAKTRRNIASVADPEVAAALEGMSDSSIAILQKLITVDEHKVKHDNVEEQIRAIRFAREAANGGKITEKMVKAGVQLILSSKEKPLKKGTVEEEEETSDTSRSLNLSAYAPSFIAESIRALGADFTKKVLSELSK